MAIFARRIGCVVQVPRLRFHGEGFKGGEELVEGWFGVELWEVED